MRCSINKRQRIRRSEFALNLPIEIIMSFGLSFPPYKVIEIL